MSVVGIKISKRFTRGSRRERFRTDLSCRRDDRFIEASIDVAFCVSFESHNSVATYTILVHYKTRF